MVEPAARNSILAALKSWDRDAVAVRVAEAEQLRAQFVDRFPREGWSNLAIEEYALGQSNQDNISYWMEYTTARIGSIKGGSAHKHLIFKAKDGSWSFPKEYASADEAWSAIRAGFVEMLAAATDGNLDIADDIAALISAPALRTKLLYMYFPNELIPVSAKTDIDHFLRSLGEQTPASTAVRANRQLLQALRTIPELSGLSNQELGFFLYHWDNPRSSQRIVKIAPGELAKYWQDCFDNGYICVGWDDVGDLTQYDTKDAFRDVFRGLHAYNGNESTVSRKANELWTLRELQPGDTVIANRGTTEVLAVGTVNDVGYKFRTDRQEYQHTVGIDWDASAGKKIDPVKAWATTTVSKVPAALFRQLFGTVPPKPIAADQSYLDLENALIRRGQVILCGPPGTGKTYMARRAAVWLLEGGSGSEGANALLADEDALSTHEGALSKPPTNSEKAARLTRVTFHPSYTYEDFLEGFRPRQSDSGTMQLELTDGIFKRVCDTARNDLGHTYVVLIDEINRGNIPKIFGELITLIEKDKRGTTFQLPQSGDHFSVPANVHIIGTMNTADRSIHLLDTALRRRFQFIELLPDSEKLEGQTVGSLDLRAFLDGLNDLVRDKFGRDKQIGHALFYQDGKVIDTPEAFASVFRYELLPLLQEYLYNDYQALGDILGSVIDTNAEQAADTVNDPDGLCDELASKFGTSASA
ncbi:MAG: AAA family ATPase [Actinomycetota bacterium]|nr:AAA family ATPase [Actinomycetota bacterium]